MKSVRSCIGIKIGICALALLLGGNVAFAAEDAESIWKTLGF